ncbi:MAG: PEP-utilizing enzyme [Patescibacteria group bacterium]
MPKPLYAVNNLYKILYDYFMKVHQLTSTAMDITKVLVENPDKEFYINELIRITGKFPNSVTNSLKRLRKLGYVRSRKVGNKIYLSISENGIENLKQSHEAIDYPTDWVKLLNRKVACSFNAAVCQANISTLKDIYGALIPSFWSNGITNGVYYSTGELINLAKKISSLIENDKDFTINDIKNCNKYCSKLVRFTKKIGKGGLKHLSNDRLRELLEQFYNYYLELLVFVAVPHSIERYFETKIRDEVKSKKDLEILLSPASLEFKELEDMLKIVEHIKKHGYDETYQNLLEEQMNNYCWLNMWDITENPLTLDHYDKSVKEIEQTLKNPAKEIEKLKNAEKNAQLKLTRTLEKVGASRSLQDHVNLLQEYIKLRTVRKNSISEAHYYIKPLLLEIAKKLNINSEDIFFLSYQEIINLMKRPSRRLLIETEILKRKGGWGILMLNGNIIILSGIKGVVEAIERYHIIPKPIEGKNNLITGRSANNGYAKGPAKIVYNVGQLNKVAKGDILVTKMTTPDFVMAMNKCAGIITDEGGITCHAAIVSREMNKPCIVGAKNATSNIQDGYIIELEATKGFARIVQKNILNQKSTRLYGKSVFGKTIFGNVKIINDDVDLARVNVGDIIVAPQLTPIALSVLYKVKGMIIEEDSLTSHAALYSKAMNIPCVMGVSNARTMLTDGEEIKVDPTNGVIERRLAG